MNVSGREDRTWGIGEFSWRYSGGVSMAAGLRIGSTWRLAFVALAGTRTLT
jgi:hypothetical protein